MISYRIRNELTDEPPNYRVEQIGRHVCGDVGTIERRVFEAERCGASLRSFNRSLIEINGRDLACGCNKLSGNHGDIAHAAADIQYAHS